MKTAIGAVILALAGCIPLGILLAIHMEDARWLWLCAPLLIFLS